MPTFENYTESQVCKMLYLGDSSAGKTGSLVSLAAAGYNVRIADLDKGTDILNDYLHNPNSIYLKPMPGLWTAEQSKTILKRMSYVRINEDMKIQAGKAIPKATGWQRLLNQLDHWKDGEVDYGNIGTWGSNDIMVLDGLSRASDAAMHLQLSMGGRLGSAPQQADWGIAQGYVENLLKLLYSSEVKCHVIVICHITFIETDAGPTKAFPQSLGKALPPKIPQYFNHALLAKSSGQGQNAKRVILTSTNGMIELKNSAPLRVKPEYDLSTGLAEYFRDIRIGAPVPVQQPVASVAKEPVT